MRFKSNLKLRIGPVKNIFSIHVVVIVIYQTHEDACSNGGETLVSLTQETPSSMENLEIYSNGKYSVTNKNT